MMLMLVLAKVWAGDVCSERMLYENCGDLKPRGRVVQAEYVAPPVEMRLSVAGLNVVAWIRSSEADDYRRPWRADVHRGRLTDLVCGEGGVLWSIEQHKWGRAERGLRRLVRRVDAEMGGALWDDWVVLSPDPWRALPFWREEIEGFRGVPRRDARNYRLHLREKRMKRRRYQRLAAEEFLDDV